MKQIKTLSNSFALIETDGNGKVLTQFGFRKGGLSYFIKNNNVKFYLTEDFFYKNVVWSADAPLMIDGIPYDIDALPDALKKIFILEDEGGGGGITVDQTLSTASTNPIGNQAVAHAVNDLNEAVSDRYTKTETDSLLDNKLDVSAYTPTDLSQYWTSGETQSAITQSLSGYATEQWVENQGYLTEHQSLDEYYTKSETDGVVDEAVSGKADTSAVTAVDDALTAHTINSNIHVNMREKTYWNNKLDASAYTPSDLSNYYTKGQTDDLLDNKLDASAYTPTDLSNYYTKGETDGVVNGAVSGKADTSAVTAVDDALTAHTINSNIHVNMREKTYWNNKLDASAYTPTDLSNYYTKGQTDDLLDEKLDASAYTPTDLSNYYTKNETDGVVNGAVSGKADTTAVTEEISAAVSGLAPESAVTALDSILTAHTADTGIHVSQEEKDGWNAKLDASAYTPVDLSEYWTSAQTEVAISAATSGMPSSQTIEQMQGDITDLQNNKLDASAYTPTDLSNYYTSAQTEAAIEAATSGKADTSAVTAVANDVSTLSGQVATKVSTSDFNTYTAATATALSGKQDALEYYSEDTETTTANIHIEDTENSTQGDISVYADGTQMTGSRNDSDEGIDYSTNINVAPDTIDITYEKSTGDETTDAHSYLYLNENNISLEVYSNEVTTTLEVNDNGVAVNNDAVATEPYVTSAISGKADTSAVTAVNDALTAHTSDTDIHVTTAQTAAWDAKLDSSTLNDYWTSTQTENAISAATSGLAETSAVTAVANDVETLSGDVETKQDALEFYSEAETEDSETGETDKYGQIEVADELNGAHVYADYFSTNEEKNPYASIDAWVNDGEGNEKQNRVYAEADGVGISADENADDGEGNIVYKTSNVSVSSTEIGMSVSEDGGNTSTTLSITSTDVTINGDTVATEPYVDAAVSGLAQTSAVTAVNNALTGHTADTTVHVTSAEKAEWNDKAEVIELTQAQYDALVTKDPDVLYVITDAAPAEVIITTSITSSSTNGQVPSAKAVFDFVGGLKMVKMTSVEYQALATKDDNTVYFVGDSTNGYTMKLGEANIN